MSLTNAPDPEIRAAVVRQDLKNVLHPIVQHKQLETKQIVVTSAHGSTIYDADGTAYLDAMAGLWCVNIGYGRGELADVAADQGPVPIAFVAATSKMYDVPFVRPDTLYPVTPMVVEALVHVLPPLEEYCRE